MVKTNYIFVKIILAVNLIGMSFFNNTNQILMKLLKHFTFLFLIQNVFSQIPAGYNASKISVINFDDNPIEVPIKDSLYGLGDSNIESYKDRIFFTDGGLEAYRDNLNDLIGRILYISPNQERGEVGLVRYLNKNVEIETFEPTNGRTASEIIKEKKNNSLSIFLEGSISKEEIVELMHTDISRGVVSNLDFNYEQLKTLMNSLNFQTKDAYIITAATVTEIIYKKYTKDEKSLRASKVPGLSLLSLDSHFYKSSEQFERKYIVGLSFSPLARAYQELNSYVNN